MGARKIQDEQELVRWMEEGRTFAWMVSEYRRKYNLEVTGSLFNNFRRRRGMDRKITRDDELIPWAVAREHRWKYAIKMLRFEARARAGGELSPKDRHELDGFLTRLEGANDLGVPLVVHYDPELESGFVLVPREPGDTDIIRKPVAGKTLRRAADR